MEALVAEENEKEWNRVLNKITDVMSRDWRVRYRVKKKPRRCACNKPASRWPKWRRLATR